MRNAPFTLMFAGLLIVVASWVAGILLVLADVAEAKDKSKVHLELRASPSIFLVPKVVTLTAELVGEGEPEDLYCPLVTWFWPDGTISEEQSDCPPYEQREEYPRRWTKRVMVDVGFEQPIPFAVEIRQGSKRLRARAEVHAKGGL